MKKIFLIFFIILLLQGCSNNYYLLPNGREILREDFSLDNIPDILYGEPEEIETACGSKTACYRYDIEKIFVSKKTTKEERRGVLSHEIAHHVILKRYPANILLEKKEQEKLVHRLLRVLEI